MSRFNFPVPHGWFYLGESAGLAPGELRPIRRFAKDLMLWRGQDGVAHLQDAYCPHLGANIAQGGKVNGNVVECPFHHWTFGGDGAVAAIPYASKINPYARLPCFPVQEHYGNLMGWYHPAGVPPLFDLPAVPQLDSGEFVGPISESHLIRTCQQEMAENTVDGAHFQTIHGHPGAAHYDGFEFDGPRMRMDSKQVFPSSRGPVEGTLSSENWGFGFAVVGYQTLVEICMLTISAPIEADVTEQVFQVYYRNPTGDEKINRIGQAFAKEVNRQLREDQPIWEQKIYRAKPYLCDGDGPFVKFRRWAKQFYAEAGASQDSKTVEEVEG